MKLPLEGLRVVDLSMYLPGPLCTQMLADFGAEVIKVEPIGGEWGRWVHPLMGSQSALFYLVNRNKKSIAINLKTETGKEIFRSLIQQADVLLEQFRPGVMEKMGLGYNDLNSINPSLIYCSISGYGHTGPLKYAAGHDLNYQSTAGLTGLNGTADKPALSGVQIADIGGGSLHAVIAILLALIARNQTGKGQFCDVSMLDGAISFLAYSLAEWASRGEVPQRGKEILSGGYACYQVYETSEGGYVSLGAIEPKFWQGFCEKLERPEFTAWQWLPDKQGEMIQSIQAQLKTRSRTEWVEYFASDDICFTPVLNLQEVMEHPQVQDREMLIGMDNFRDIGNKLIMAGIPIKLSDTPGIIKIKFAELGENTEEILRSLGYARDTINRLKEEKTIK